MGDVSASGAHDTPKQLLEQVVCMSEKYGTSPEDPVTDVIGEGDFNDKLTAVVEEPIVDVAVCCVCGSSKDVRCCGNCKAAKYCSKGCQQEHWSYHSVCCNATTKSSKQ